jgi:hypothetical protein
MCQEFRAGAHFDNEQCGSTFVMLTDWAGFFNSRFSLLTDEIEGLTSQTGEKTTITRERNNK